MYWLKSIYREIVGLFVEDGNFALAILSWIAIAWLFLSRMSLSVFGGIILFVGLALILIESVTRFAKKQQNNPKNGA